MMTRLLTLCLAAPLLVLFAMIAVGSTDPKPVANAAFGSVVGWVTVTLIPAKADDRRDRKRVRNLRNIGHSADCAMDMAIGHQPCSCLKEAPNV